MWFLCIKAICSALQASLALSSGCKYWPRGIRGSICCYVKHELASWVQPSNSILLPVVTLCKQAKPKRYHFRESGGRWYSCSCLIIVCTDKWLPSRGKQMRWALELLVKTCLLHLCAHPVSTPPVWTERVTFSWELRAKTPSILYSAACVCVTHWFPPHWSVLGQDMYVQLINNNFPLINKVYLNKNMESRQYPAVSKACC